MAAGQRIKTRVVTRDIKSIDRAAIMTGRVRSVYGRGAGAAGSVTHAAFSDDRESQGPAEAVATEKATGGARTLAGSALKASFGVIGKAGSPAKGGAARAVHERRRVREYAVKDRCAVNRKIVHKKRFAERTVIQGRRLAQIKAAKKMATSAKKIRKASAALKRALRALIAAFRSFTALLFSGGGVVLAILIIIVIVVAIVASPIGIFLSNDPGSGGTTTREVVQALGDDFSEYILGIEESNPHDELIVIYTGGKSMIDWKGVLAVYVAKVNQNGSDSMDVVSFDDEKQEILRGVMWDMNEVSHQLIHENRERTVTRTGEDGKPEEVTETVIITTLKITITQKSPDEMAAVYTFSGNQKKALAELLDPEYDDLWDELLGGFVAGGGMREPSKDRIPTGPFTWPFEIPGVITSFFGWREDPFTGAVAYHEGVDIAASTGTPVLAAADGVVTAANGTDSYGGGYGYYVKIRHAGGYETLYAHCSAVAVRAGDTVKRGQIIGYVGNTGRSKGPHLHWEVYKNGGLIDPLSYFR